MIVSSHFGALKLMHDLVGDSKQKQYFYVNPRKIEAKENLLNEKNMLEKIQEINLADIKEVLGFKHSLKVFIET
jgi:FAD synthase